MQEKESLKEEMAMLHSRTEYFQASTVDRETITRLEAKLRDAEAKLDFEQSTKHRVEVWIRGSRVIKGLDLGGAIIL